MIAKRVRRQRDLRGSGSGESLLPLRLQVGFATVRMKIWEEVGEMTVSKELLDILVCPQDKAPVHLTPNQTGLKCEQCNRVYPIKDDIPVMLVDEAIIEKE